MLLLGCDRAASPLAGPTREFTDARGKAVRVPFPPKRIVSVVPSATELLFAAGAGDQVTAVTTYCDWPPEARAKPKIGDIVVDWEKLASLHPDVILTSWSLTRKTTEDLEKKGYVVFAVDANDFDEIARTLRTLGDMTGHPEGAKAADALLARARSVADRDGPTFYFEHSPNPLGTTGPESYTGRALRQAGGRNIFDGGWRTADWESVLARDPDVILIAHDRREGLERRAGWKDLKAVKSGRVHLVAKEHYVYPTPRLADGLEEAARLFHAKNP